MSTTIDTSHIFNPVVSAAKEMFLMLPGERMNFDPPLDYEQERALRHILDSKLDQFVFTNAYPKKAWWDNSKSCGPSSLVSATRLK